MQRASACGGLPTGLLIIFLPPIDASHFRGGKSAVLPPIESHKCSFNFEKPYVIFISLFLFNIYVILS